MKRAAFFFLLSVDLLLNPLTAIASSDTLQIKAGKHFVLNDSLYYVASDTTIIISGKDNVISGQDDLFYYDKLRAISDRNRITSELYRQSVRAWPQNPSSDIPDLKESDLLFEAVSGMVIRSIRIQKLDLIGPTVNDTARKANSKASRILNKVHFPTRDKTILNHLLIKQGDTVNPWVLVDNQKIIRELPFIENARFYFNIVDKDSIDLILVIKDNIRYGAVPLYYSGNRQSLRVSNGNVMGLGGELGVGIIRDERASPDMFFSRAYLKANNIAGSFVNGEINYQKSWDTELKEFVVQRSFQSALLKVAGGLQLRAYMYRMPDWRIPDPTQPFSAAYQEGILWGGYQFDIAHDQVLKRKPVVLVPTLGIYMKQYQSRLEVTADSNLFMSHHKSLLGSINLMSRRYLQSGFLLEQDKDRDVPVGYKINITGGYTFGEFFSMPYFGLEVQTALKINRLGYLNSSIEFGAHLTSKHQFRQGALNFTFNHASPLIHLNSYKIRFLSTASHTHGINRYTEDSLYLNNSFGVVGFNSTAYKGTSRITATLKTMIYTPWKKLGFRFTPFVLFSIGFIENESLPIFAIKPVTGIGAGIRIRNEYLIFSSLEIRLMYYPNNTLGNDHWSADIMDESNFQIHDFILGAPSFVPFR
jgi:hypothetical protein